MGKNSANRSNGNDEEQRADEQIRGNEESCPGIFSAAHINERENSENNQTNPELVWLQFRECRDQRAHACRDANSSVQNVVDHQRGGGEQTGGFAQVFCSNGIAAAAMGVGIDRLAVGKVNNSQ